MGHAGETPCAFLSLWPRVAVGERFTDSTAIHRFGVAARPTLGTASPWGSVGRRTVSLHNPNGCLGP